MRVVLCTRAGCHLCDDARQLLETARSRYGFTLTTVDVDGDPALAAQHGKRVPVIVVDDRERFWGRINPVLLERLFRAESRRR
jgi:glutaredoxin